jgi:mannitol/fructose-specific phosphotransferase system IIA component (Ntr-type)
MRVATRWSAMATLFPRDQNECVAELIFLLLTANGMARIQPRLLADIAGLIDSDYVAERLRTTKTPEEVIEAIRAGQQVVLD